jgi:prepilin-type N-terminal cleavage/methylation domain-containing protein
MKRDKKGFTLVELIIVLAILAVLAGILVPSLVGWIDTAKRKVCEINRTQILRCYRAVQAMEYGKDTEVKLSDVLAGEYAFCAEDVAGLTCPAGGTLTADDASETIICDVHGAMTETGGSGDPSDNPNVDPSGSPGGDPGNTKDYFYLTGDQNYRVETWGDLETFNPEHDGEPGTNIPDGAVFYYRGDYYLFRNNQYLTKSTDLPTFVANYGVKVNNTTFTTPSPATQKGDLKLKDGKAYIFFPYSRYTNDHLNESWWYEISVTP